MSPSRPRPRRPLREIFDRHEGRLIHKCEHYFPIYERHLSTFRGRSPRVLEIGVSHGGSLEMWLTYFGRGTEIVGLDVDPRCADARIPHATIVIGDQGDAEVLRRVADEHGPFDVVIEDGSHLPEHQILAFETLWPAVARGGVMLVEDLCTNYWPEYGGATGGPGTFMEYVRALVDRINAFNVRDGGLEPDELTRTCGGIHVYDSVVVFDRLDTAPLRTITSGRPAFDVEASLDLLDAGHRRRIEEMNRPHRRVIRALRSPRRTAAAVADRVRAQITR